MEQHMVRTDIKGCEALDCCANYILFSGKMIQSCAKYGDALFQYPRVKYFLSSIAQISESQILVEDGRKNYHILDLDEGKVLCSRKMPKDRMTTHRFAVSEDGSVAYRIWSRGCNYEVLVIDLADLSYSIYPYRASLSYISDIVFSKKNELLVLESQVNEDGTCQNQVTSLCIVNGECITAPLHTWSGQSVAKYFDGRYVWESGYHIRDLHTGRCFWLLEKSDVPLPANHVAIEYKYYPEKKYLQIIDRQQNVFIDCEKRKMIARYLRKSQNDSYMGILIGEEFWIGKSDGIYSMPFPAIETPENLL